MDHKPQSSSDNCFNTKYLQLILRIEYTLNATIVSTIKTAVWSIILKCTNETMAVSSEWLQWQWDIPSASLRWWQCSVKCCQCCQVELLASERRPGGRCHKLLTAQLQRVHWSASSGCNENLGCLFLNNHQENFALTFHANFLHFPLPEWQPVELQTNLYEVLSCVLY